MPDVQGNLTLQLYPVEDTLQLSIASGLPGSDGSAASISIAPTETLDHDDPADVTNTGTSTAAILNFKIPRGAPGVVESIVEGDNITVDATDPANPIVSGAREIPFYETVADAEAATPPAGTDQIFVASYTTAIAGSAANYKSVGSEPSHGAKLQMDDGSWWEISDSILNARSMGVTGDGTTDDSEALQAWASAGSYYKLLLWPAGSYRVTGTNAVALDVADYVYGDLTLDACVVFPAGVKVLTAGTATQLIVDTPNSDTCGVAIAIDVAGNPTSHSQIRTSIDRFLLRAEDANGKYGVITPAKSGLFAGKRPRHDINVHFAPPRGEDDQTISDYGWTNGILLGDCVDSTVNFTGYGTYNATIDDSGQHQMTGLRIKSVTGAIGVDIKFQVSNMRTLFDGSDGLEGHSITNSEGFGAYYGIYYSSSGGEPGGYIDNVHLNVNKIGVRAYNRTSFQIGKVEVYRADGWHDHGGQWDGIVLDTCSPVSIGGAHIIHGSVITRTTSNGINATSSSFRIDGAVLTMLANGFLCTNCVDCVVGDSIVNTVATLHNLTGATTSGYAGGECTARAGTTVYLLRDSSVTDVKSLRFPQNSLLSVRNHQEITASGAGSTDVNMRTSPSSYDLIMSGTATFNYDLILKRDTAVVGDIVDVKVITGSSANPTIRICDDSTGTIMDTFNNLSSKRYKCRYVFRENGTWGANMVVESIETTL